MNWPPFLLTLFVFGVVAGTVASDIYMVHSSKTRLPPWQIQSIYALGGIILFLVCSWTGWNLITSIGGSEAALAMPLLSTGGGYSGGSDWLGGLGIGAFGRAWYSIFFLCLTLYAVMMIMADSVFLAAASDPEEKSAVAYSMSYTVLFLGAGAAFLVFFIRSTWGYLRSLQGSTYY